MQHRVIVVPVIRNRAGEILICRMPPHRGVYPGEWGLPGGGIEEGETMGDALRREVAEELGLDLTHTVPAFFKDATHSKRLPDGAEVTVYMIFLIFECRTAQQTVRLNAEWDAYAWVPPDRLGTHELNSETLATFDRLGIR